MSIPGAHERRLPLKQATDDIKADFRKVLQYFFGYKAEVFTFLNNPNTLDPSYKMEIDLWDCSGRVKLVL